jgi:MFS-type transporter involved in bile tolerance (Atg22 family)
VFFGLFGITNRASSLIGPNVCSAIIETSGNSRQPFIFLLIICVLASLVITFFVDVPKGRAMAVTFAIEERGLHSEVRVEQMVPQDGAK